MYKIYNNEKQLVATMPTLERARAFIEKTNHYLQFSAEALDMENEQRAERRRQFSGLGIVVRKPHKDGKYAAFMRGAPLNIRGGATVEEAWLQVEQGYSRLLGGAA